jgi:hypothetical protein
MYFKFMRLITPAMFRLMFGIHAFIPFMISMHQILPPHVYGWLGYKVFSFLFGWTDDRWDRGLRDRMFQFAPVYVSAESMRWWLGRECFARHKCILATKEEWRAEEREDNEAEKEHDMVGKAGYANDDDNKEGALGSSKTGKQTDVSPKTEEVEKGSTAGSMTGHRRKPKGATAWYNEQAPPFALWICGNDKLVDGDKLIRRFERGREPHVEVVYQTVIPEYEHLDVIWAIDAPKRVFKELREVLWKTCRERAKCRVPPGCEGLAEWIPRKERKSETEEEKSQSSSSDDES